MTMAGDYEYFAAQGRAPFAFAVAELVDNALRAVRLNGGGGGGGGRIEITFATNASGTAGLVSVWDNGTGMGTSALADWAVMNLSVAERGVLAGGGGGSLPVAAPLPPSPPPPGSLAASRHLTGDLSYFGVGSKNAAFFLGRAVRVSTKRAGDRAVHELSISADALDARYRAAGRASNASAAASAPADVYVEDVVHRNPGEAAALVPAATATASSLPGEDGAFAELVGSWVAGEAAAPSSTASSFTRVTVGALKPAALAALAADRGGHSLCAALAHIYHYYLHGPAGRGKEGEGGEGGEGASAWPAILARGVVGGREAWATPLASIADDLESRYLTAAASEFRFTLAVPGKGDVAGVLWYFPYEGGRETLPGAAAAAGQLAGVPGGCGGLLDTHHADHPITNFDMTQHQSTAVGTVGTAQGGAGGGLTADGGGGGAAGGSPGGDGYGSADEADAEDAAAAAAAARAPAFEAFWQGRLIPGARIESLPFIEAVRCRRSASARDALPDAVFARLRGALFFGPDFLVTRNKLTFRDDLGVLLSAASPANEARAAAGGGLDRRFRDWLAGCHGRFDKTVRFEGRLDGAGQAGARAAAGAEGITAYARCTDGTADRTFAAGDVVRLAVKPGVVGEVLHFTLPGAVAAGEPAGEDGGGAPGSPPSLAAGAGGRVWVQPLPVEVWGRAAIRSAPLRRLERAVSAEEAADHAARERARAPRALRLEPLRLAAAAMAIDGGVAPSSAAAAPPLPLTAGDALPETAVVVLTGGGARATRAPFGGGRVPLAVIQRLWFHPVPVAVGSASAPAGGGDGPPPPPPALLDASAGGVATPPPGDPLAGAVLVASVDNRTPGRDGSFRFQRLGGKGGALRAPGRYTLEYVTSPVGPEGGAGAPRLLIPLAVSPGHAVSFDLAGPARLAATSATPLMLGSPLPDLDLVFRDAAGQRAAAPARLLAAVVAKGGAASAAAGAPCLDLSVLAAPAPGDDGSSAAPTPTHLADLYVSYASAKASPDGCGLTLTGLTVLGAPGCRRLTLFSSVECTPPGGVLSPELGQAGPPSDGAANTGDFVRTQQTAGGVGPDAPRPAHALLAVALGPGMVEPAGVGSSPAAAATALASTSARLSLRLRPGPPVEVELMPGHPWAEDSGGGGGADAAALTQVPRCAPSAAPPCLPAGSALPPFTARALDAWGTPTWPQDGSGNGGVRSTASSSPGGLAFDLVVSSAALTPTPATFCFGADGLARVAGLKAIRPPQDDEAAYQPSAPVTFSLATRVGTDLAAAAALDASGPPRSLTLRLEVEPSRTPAAVRLLWNGVPLPLSTDAESAGVDGPVACLGGVAAGEAVGGLALVLVDEAGRPALGPAPGRVQVSWLRGHKKVDDLSSGPAELPPLPAPETAADAAAFWVRVKVSAVGGAPALVLEGGLLVTADPGPPIAWQVRLADRDAASSPVCDGDAAAGVPFGLEVEAADAHGNRCVRGGDPDLLPPPSITLDADGALEADPASWPRYWSPEGVLSLTATLSGAAGRVTVHVGQADGGGGGGGARPALAPDSLTLALAPGPPAKLGVDALPRGAAAAAGQVPIPLLRVRVLDACGNVCVSLSGPEVALLPGALAADGKGGAAAVSLAAPGPARAALARGVATFANVRVVAEEGGGAAAGEPRRFAVRVKPASARGVGGLGAEAGECVVALAPSNAVASLSLASSSSAAASLPAGAEPAFVVTVTTADGAPLPPDAAVDGLTLRVTPPHPHGSHGATGEVLGASAHPGGRARGGRGRAGAAPAAPPRLAVSAPTPIPDAPGAFSITVSALTLAGDYSVAAEYQERRGGLNGGGCGEDGEDGGGEGEGEGEGAAAAAAALPATTPTLIRSVALAFSIVAGPPAGVVITPAPPSTIPAADGPDPAARALLPSAGALPPTAQVVDPHGNPAWAGNIRLRVVLVGCQDDPVVAATRRGGALEPGASLLEGGVIGGKTDRDGRLDLSDVSVAPGAVAVLLGTDENADPAAPLPARLVVLARGLEGGGAAPGAPAWAPAWECAVLLARPPRPGSGGTDAGGGAEALRAAAAEHAAAVEARDALAGRIEDARGEAEAAAGGAAAAARAATAARRAALAAGVADPPSSPGAARKASRAAGAAAAAAASSLAAAEAAAEEASGAGVGPPLPPRWGPPGKPQTAAVSRCLELGAAADRGGRGAPPGLPPTSIIGVVAALGCADDPALAAVLALQFRALLPVVVVATPAARGGLAACLAAESLPLPDVLALTHIQAYAGPVAGAGGGGGGGGGAGGGAADAGEGGGRAGGGGRRGRAAAPAAPAPDPATLIPGFKGASARAHRLVVDACGGGSDPPLPIPLPHARALAMAGARAAAASGRGPGWPPAAPADPPPGVPAARDWPAGCCGYAVNLVRPTRAGDRAGILYAVLGATLVFETLDAASAYREAVAGGLRVGCGDLITLDGGRVTAKGIVSGASFATVAPGKAMWRFGGIPPDQRGGGGGGPPVPAAAAVAAQGPSAAAVAALDRLAAALAAAASATAAADAARAAAERVAGRWGADLEAAEARVEELAATLAAGGAGGKGKRGRVAGAAEEGGGGGGGGGGGARVRPRRA